LPHAAGQERRLPVGWRRRHSLARRRLETGAPGAAVEAHMGLMDSLRNLFGSGGKAESRHEAVEYQGYLIRPAPQRQASGWNTAGVISKEFPDGVKEHSFIRVDTHSSQDDAVAFSVVKAQQIIDEQGDRLFR
jgi:hypothetical protein